GPDLIEGDDAKAGIVCIGRVRQRNRERADCAGDKSGTRSLVCDAIGPQAALPRGLLVDLPGQIVQKPVCDDALVERRILARAVLSWIVDEELALRDTGGSEGIGFDDVG